MLTVKEFPNGTIMTEFPDGTIMTKKETVQHVDWEHPVYLLHFNDSDEGPYLLASFSWYDDDAILTVSIYPIPDKPEDIQYCSRYVTNRATWERVTLTPIFPEPWVTKG